MNALRAPAATGAPMMPGATAHHTVMLPVRKHLQAHPWSCGPASLKIVLDMLGFELGEQALIEMTGANPVRGTQPHALAAALTRLKVRHEVVETGDLDLLEERIRDFQYCIVDYQAWGTRGRDYHLLRAGHYSVVFGFNLTHVFIADPAKKPRKGGDPWGARGIRKDLFRRRWRDRGPGGIRTHRWMLCVPLVQPRLRGPP